MSLENILLTIAILLAVIDFILAFIIIPQQKQNRDKQGGKYDLRDLQEKILAGKTERQ